MHRRMALCLPLLGAVVAAAPDARVCRGTACEVAASDHDSHDAVDEVSLLSVKHRILASGWRAQQARGPPALAAMDAESQRERLEAARPIAWLHVPKCGSSLNNFMIHLPGICPGVDEGLVISEETMGIAHNFYFKQHYDPLHKKGACPGSFSHWGNHTGAGPTWDEQYAGHCFVMLRQPEQRTLSAYHYGQHSWPESLPASNELQFAERIQGCAVRMITQGGTSPSETCGGRDTGLPTWDEVTLAIHRIRTGCAFVGLTDQWPLSMCLGHRIFGGKCRVADFVDGRITTKGGGVKEAKTKIAPDPHLYDLTPLGGFTDPYDGALYQAALEVFQENLLRYNVSMEACQPCFEEAGVDISA